MKTIEFPGRSSLAAFLLMIGATSGADDGASCDLEQAEQMFQRCAICHSAAADAPHRAGPNLYGVIDRPVGKVAGFKFSRRMRESEKTWTIAHLDAFIENPAGVYKRTRMAFSGLKTRADRDAVICYLQHAQ